MIFRFAAACALALEMLMFFHVISLPLLHNAPPFMVTGSCLMVALIVAEMWEIAGSVWGKLKFRKNSPPGGPQ